MGGMMLLLIVLVDWPEKFGEFNERLGLEEKGELVGLDLPPTDVGDGTIPEDDTTFSLPDTSLMRALFPEALGLPAVSNQNRYSAFRLPPLPPAKSSQPSSEPAPLPAPAPPAFEDVSEEPYLRESRRLTKQIRSHYEKITAGKAPKSESGQKP
jgi:hypothetical protein